jgi:hypothetical protein
MDDDLIAAAMLIVKDAGDAAGRMARDFDRLANLLGSLLPEPDDEPVQLRAIDD